MSDDPPCSLESCQAEDTRARAAFKYACAARHGPICVACVAFTQNACNASRFMSGYNSNFHADSLCPLPGCTGLTSSVQDSQPVSDLTHVLDDFPVKLVPYRDSCPNVRIHLSPWQYLSVRRPPVDSSCAWIWRIITDSLSMSRWAFELLRTTGRVWLACIKTCCTCFMPMGLLSSRLWVSLHLVQG